MKPLPPMPPRPEGRWDWERGGWVPKRPAHSTIRDDEPDLVALWGLVALIVFVGALIVGGLAAANHQVEEWRAGRAEYDRQVMVEVGNLSNVAAVPWPFCVPTCPFSTVAPTGGQP